MGAEKAVVAMLICPIFPSPGGVFLIGGGNDGDGGRGMEGETALVQGPHFPPSFEPYTVPSRI